ncbi:MAG: type II secretion system F family protein [Rhabdochlamydiaceae bacterium]|nr:type II secretion system F family protein [Rhabdochlamydiaceae bacterium]
MPLFRYRALSTEGKNYSGVIDADSFNLAKERLRKQQILVTDLVLLKTHLQEITLDPPLLLLFTRELAQLLRAGLPLYESLVTIEEKYRKHKSHPLLIDLCDHLKGGSSLSTALKRYPKTFDRIYLSMVQVSEQSGNMAHVFTELAQLISRQQKLKKQLFSALAYPAFLGAFCICIVLALLFFIIPSMADLFEGRHLHPLTQLVLSISNWANTHIPFLLSCALGIPLIAFLFCRRESTRLFLQQLSTRIPFLNSVILHSSLVRFCRATSMLITGGIPLHEALSLSQNVMKNLLLETAIKKVEAKIIEGQRLSAAFQADPVLPPLVTRMLATAEETGNMADAFLSLAEIYEEEVEKHLAQLNTFLQPALLILLGAIVGMVILSILLPLTDVSSFTQI